jgi:SAM-dependent methyltransferase
VDDMMHARHLLLALLMSTGVGCEREAAPLTTPSPPSASAAASVTVEAPDDGVRFYLGRQLAPTMSHEGASWLVRPEREAEEASTRMVDELGLGAGDTACDLGAGNGYHTLMLARRVAKTGRVLAIDIQPEMLALLRARAKEARVVNVETILGTPSDPRLPPGACDLVLMVDVYHELSEPAAVLAHVRAALSGKGRLALVEFREEDPEVPIKPLHKMSKAQIRRERAANGFAPAGEFDGLPWQHLMFFAPRRER